MADALAHIEKWFSGEYEEGDFYRHRIIRYEIISPAPDCYTIFYCSKRFIAFTSIDEVRGEFCPGLISRGGLPSGGDTEWLSSFTEGRQLCFVGDLDPADLMIYEWLRLKLAPTQVIHHAINDRFIADHDVNIPQNYIIPLNTTELAAAAELREIIADFDELIGPWCAALLDNGRKVELEAVRWSLDGCTDFFKLK